MSPATYESADFQRKRSRTEAGTRFLCDLARSLHRYGTPADRLEATLELCAQRLGLTAQFFASPTSILVSVESKRGAVSRMIRVEESELHLEKLIRTDDVIRQVINGRLPIDEARRRLVEIEGRRDRFGPISRVLGFTVAGMLVAVLFGVGGRDVALTGIAALGAGITCSVFSWLTRLRPLAIPVAAAVATCIAFSDQDANPTSAPLITLSSLILLMPGLKLTTAMRELAMSHLTAGTTRMVAAIRTLLGLAFGVVLGRRLAEEVDVPWTFLPDLPLPADAWVLAVVIFPLVLLVDFNARFRDLPAIAIGCFVAYFAARWGRSAIGPEIGAFVGALAVGVASNLYARVKDLPASVMLIPGVTLLVPGSIGFRSVVALMEHDALVGVDSGFAMIMAGTALGSGLIVANVVLPPRRVL